MSQLTLNILSAFLMFGLLFIFVGMPVFGIVAWRRSRKHRAAGASASANR
jgi:hypothetical protein